MAARKNAPARDERPAAERAREAVAALEALATQKDRDNLVRFGINAEPAFGVSMSNIQKVAKTVGKSHAVAAALWESGWYEARMLAAFVDEPERVTPAQMDRWCRGFDNWGICDTICFVLFDRTPHAFAKVDAWARSGDEFVKRAAFALLASLSGHDKTTGDGPFLDSLALIEKAATDDRNFVKKGVLWALKGVGRRSPVLRREAVALARKLAASDVPSARFIGRDALRDLTRKQEKKKGKGPQK